MIISIIALVLSTLLLFFSVYLFYKLRFVVIPLVLAAKPSHALPVDLPSFHFTFPSEITTTETPSISVPITDHACYSTYILVVIIVVILAFLIYRSYKRKTKSAIYLEFNTPSMTLLCKVMALPSSCTVDCHFTGTVYLDTVSVSGYIRPTLPIDWGDFKVHHNSFSVPISPPATVSINTYQTYILGKNFLTQFMLSPRLLVT